MWTLVPVKADAIKATIVTWSLQEKKSQEEYDVFTLSHYQEEQ